MFNLNAKGPIFAVAEARAADQTGRLYRLHDLDRQRQGNAWQHRMRGGQGRGAILRSHARH